MDNKKIITLINLMFFHIGLCVSLVSVLIPEVIDGFQTTYGMASLLPFSFYLALSLACIPAGIAGEKFRTKSLLLFAYLFSLAGVLLFGLSPGYGTLLLSLIMTGISVAVVQVNAVPLLRRTCGPANLAFHSTLNQFMYGTGAFLSPLIYSWLSRATIGFEEKQNAFPEFLTWVRPQGLEWVAGYWVLGFFLIIMIVTILLSRIEDHSIHDPIAGSTEAWRYLFQRKYLLFYFLGLVAYASCEQGIAAWMSKFFQDYHGIDPQTEGAALLSAYWFLLMLGCLGGMFLLEMLNSRMVLFVVALLALISLLFALYGNTAVSRVAFPAMAAFESVMWPVILSMALNSVRKHHETLSGIMFAASVGGALGPGIIGRAADWVGLDVSLNYLFLALLIVLSLSFCPGPGVNPDRER
ncbi:MAG: MFS transporter [Mangrovibacterium sp.]|nr:MFS transporter [Mangrovibacterium sp.]